jgi:hypothetical protein
MDTTPRAPSTTTPAPQMQVSDAGPAVPPQTITFSSDPAMKPAPTAQLSVASADNAGPNGETDGEGWIIKVHGDIVFDLQLTLVDAVRATFRITSSASSSIGPIGATSTTDMHNGNDACYNVDVNGSRVVDHERCSFFRDWHDHDVDIPVNVPQIGTNAIALSVSDRGGSELGIESITVQSPSSAA